MEFHHVSVLLNEVIKYLDLRQGGTYVDCTLGGGGHSLEILERIQPGGRVIGIDQDPNALEAARQKLARFEASITLVHSNFFRLREIADSIGLTGVDGILFDLGVSSHQLDVGERGFSYMQDAPLDMRMNPEDPVSAKQLVNQLDEEELTRIIKDYGEERWARRIAKFVIEARQTKTIESTVELVEIIKKAIPAEARRDGPHPAKRTFQALRIAVNDELNRFKKTLQDAADILKPGGRVCVISFHSLEDRITKEVFRELALDCICPPGFPVCRCDKQRLVKVVTSKPVLPSPEELAVNPRARSAKLRAAEKVQSSN